MPHERATTEEHDRPGHTSLEPGHWRYAPEPRKATSDRGSSLARPLLAVFVAVGGPTLRAYVLPDDQPAFVFVIGVAAAFTMTLFEGRLSYLRVAVPVLAGAAVLPGSGQLLAIWLTLGLYLADWGIRQRAPLPFIPKPGPGATAPVVTLAAVAAYQGLNWEATYQPLVVLAVAFLMPLLTRLGGGALDRFSNRVGQAVGNATSWVSFSLLGVVMVGVPWAIHRIVRLDPLAQGGSGHWAERDRRDVRPRQPWTTEAAVARPGVVRRLQGTATVLLTMGLVAAVAIPSYAKVREVAAETRVNTFPIPPAQVGNDWFREYEREITWAKGEAAAWRPLRLLRMADVSGRYLNVADGVRKSWQAPPCGCRRMTVWLYGGSTIFGLGQRDEHTIASELARTAAAEGITLDVVNRGQLGHVHWMEAQHFAWDLTLDDPPDLVLFYDGYNDHWTTFYLSDSELARPDQPINPLAEEIWTNARTEEPDPTGPGRARLTEQPASGVDQLGPVQFGQLVAERYARAMKLSGDVAAANDIPVHYFWQPVIYDRMLAVEGEPSGDDDEGTSRERAKFKAAAAALPDQVVNLTNTFNDVSKPLFTDDVHHNELGARLIAEAMFDNIHDELLQIRDELDPAGQEADGG